MFILCCFLRVYFDVSKCVKTTSPIDSKEEHRVGELPEEEVLAILDAPLRLTEDDLRQFEVDTGAGSHFGVLKGIKIQHFFRRFLRLYSLEIWASKYTPFLGVRQAKVTSVICRSRLENGV